MSCEAGAGGVTRSAGVAEMVDVGEGDAKLLRAGSNPAPGSDVVSGSPARPSRGRFRGPLDVDVLTARSLVLLAVYAAMRKDSVPLDRMKGRS